jgi:hypothetical protein
MKKLTREQMIEWLLECATEWEEEKGQVDRYERNLDRMSDKQIVKEYETRQLVGF